jgi:hypothetical protein
VSTDFRQDPTVLVKDLARGASLTIEFKTGDRLIRLLSGTSDEATVTLLIQFCGEVAYGEFLQCLDDHLGIVQVPRQSGRVDAKIHDVPALISRSVRSVAFDGQTIRLLSISLEDALKDLGQPNLYASIEVFESRDGGEFRSVTQRQSGNAEPCFTRDGSLWDLDAAAGGVIRFNQRGEWESFPGAAVQPLATIACGISGVAVMDPASNRLSLADTSAADKFSLGDVPEGLFGSDLITSAFREVEFDAVDDVAFRAADTRLFEWSRDGSVAVTPLAGDVVGLPRAAGTFWRSSGTDEPALEAVAAK